MTQLLEMKRILLTLFLLCTANQWSSAQKIEEPPSRLEKTRFGVKVGISISNTDFNRGMPTPVVPVETSWKPGVAIGALVQIPLYRAISLQQEYTYLQMGGKINSSGTEYRFDYLSIPLLLKIATTSRTAIFIGSQFDLLIQANQKVNGVTADISHDVEERSIGATIGAEYYVTKKLALMGRYTHGLNHIGIGQRSSGTEFMYESLQFGAEITF